MKAKLSMAFQDLRGKDGNVVIKRNRSGLILTPRITPSNPGTLAQKGVRGNMTKAAKTYKGLTESQGNAWEAYGATLIRHNPITGQTYTSTGINAFVELATKFLQVTPGGTIPLTPPSTPFTGDGITITVEAGTSALVFEASASNTGGVKTELLVQKLDSINCKPDPGAYRSRAFTAFSEDPPEETIPVAPGVYACAYRFVKIATGEATELVTLAPLSVSLSLVKGSSETSTPKKKAA